MKQEVMIGDYNIAIESLNNNVSVDFGNGKTLKFRNTDNDSDNSTITKVYRGLKETWVMIGKFEKMSDVARQFKTFMDKVVFDIVIWEQLDGEFKV